MEKGSGNTRDGGCVFVVAAPSGAGKTSLVHALLEADSSIRLSVSHTTRKPRPGEADGREYHFVTVEEFEAEKDRGEFLEWALVHGNYYGTSRLWIEEQVAAGRDVVLEIDWQGARQVRKFFPATGIFILPPTLEELERRLRGRGTDSAEVISCRLAGAAAEIIHAPEFEYVLINDDFSASLASLQAIVAASRLSFRKQAARHAGRLRALGVPV